MSTLSDISDKLCLHLRNMGRAVKKAFDYCLDCCIDGFYVVADALDYILSIPVTISDYICIRAERAERNNEKLENTDDNVTAKSVGGEECNSGTCKYCSGERCGLDEFAPRRE